MPKEYVVQRGDNLTTIARKHGLSSWREIYFHSENSEFRRKHPNPNVIHPGDRLVIPDPSSGVTPPQNIPQLVRLPWSYSSLLGLPLLLPLVVSDSQDAPPPTTLGSLPLRIVDPRSYHPPFLRPPGLPRQPLSWFGTGRPRTFGSCGPWGCARGPYDLDLPRPGTVGEFADAVWNVPQVQQYAGSVGDYLWSEAPPGRRWLVGTTAGVAIAGAVTAFVTSESIRQFTLEQLHDVQLPVGEALLLIPGLDRRPWVRSVLSPIQFSLIWQEPGSNSGDDSGLTPPSPQGQGGVLILDLSDLVNGK